MRFSEVYMFLTQILVRWLDNLSFIFRILINGSWSDFNCGCKSCFDNFVTFHSQTVSLFSLSVPLSARNWFCFCSVLHLFWSMHLRINPTHPLKIKPSSPLDLSGFDILPIDFLWEVHRVGNSFESHPFNQTAKLSNRPANHPPIPFSTHTHAHIHADSRWSFVVVRIRKRPKKNNCCTNCWLRCVLWSDFRLLKTFLPILFVFLLLILSTWKAEFLLLLVLLRSIITIITIITSLCANIWRRSCLFLSPCVCVHRFLSSLFGSSQTFPSPPILHFFFCAFLPAIGFDLWRFMNF